MILDDLYIKRYPKRYGADGYRAGYDFWLRALFERAMRLFVWTGTGDVPPKEIEGILLSNGSAGVLSYKKAMGVFAGEYSGTPTIYYDEWRDYSFHSPVYSGTRRIGRDIVVIQNDSCRTSIMPLCHRYAAMLAHTEVSLVDTLINGRDAGGVPIASTEAQKKSIEEYRNALCNGRVGAILDPAFSGVDFKTTTSNTQLNIKDLVEVRENLLDAFYADLGVRTGYKKKGNMIQDEISADDPKLLLNISDMLHMRQLGAEKVNALYGTSWSVDIAPELKKAMEREETLKDE